MVKGTLDHTTVPIDQAAAFALEQMALTEGCSVAAVLQAAISSRWQAHREAEIRRRETACRAADQDRRSGDPDKSPYARVSGDTTLRLVGCQSSQRENRADPDRTGIY